MKEIQWQKLQGNINHGFGTSSSRLKIAWIDDVLFGAAFFRSCLHPEKKWNFQVESFQAKACIPKKNWRHSTVQSLLSRTWIWPSSSCSLSHRVGSDFQSAKALLIFRGLERDLPEAWSFTGHTGGAPEVRTVVCFLMIAGIPGIRFQQPQPEIHGLILWFFSKPPIFFTDYGIHSNMDVVWCFPGTRGCWTYPNPNPLTFGLENTCFVSIRSVGIFFFSDFFHKDSGRSSNSLNSKFLSGSSATGFFSTGFSMGSTACFLGYIWYIYIYI